MGKRFDEISDEHADFIAKQHLFFVATADVDGHVNLSPKGLDSLRVLSPNRVLWLNLTGSGNETATHIRDNGRMTLMFCSFGKQPLILRLYGRADVVHSRDPQWSQLLTHFPDFIGARQIFDMRVELVQTSCGFAVPYYSFVAERETLTNFADKRGREGIREYWKERNTLSLNGKKTGIVIEE